MRFKIPNSTFKIAIAIAVAIVTIWGGHTYAMTPTTPECPPTVGTRYIASTAYIASTGATPASARSCRVQKRSFCLPEQFKIQNSPFQITLQGGSQSNEQSCDPRRCPQVRTIRSIVMDTWQINTAGQFIGGNIQRIDIKNNPNTLKSTIVRRYRTEFNIGLRSVDHRRSIGEYQRRFRIVIVARVKLVYGSVPAYVDLREYVFPEQGSRNLGTLAKGVNNFCHLTPGKEVTSHV